MPVYTQTHTHTRASRLCDLTASLSCRSPEGPVQTATRNHCKRVRNDKNKVEEQTRRVLGFRADPLPLICQKTRHSHSARFEIKYDCVNNYYGKS